jgi:hypothetical protein
MSRKLIENNVFFSFKKIAIPLEKWWIDCLPEKQKSKRQDAYLCSITNAMFISQPPSILPLNGNQFIP